MWKYKQFAGDTKFVTVYMQSILNLLRLWGITMCEIMLCKYLGWEYTVEATLGGYGPVEKRYHMCRRRRWVRMRKVVKTVKLQAAEVCSNLNDTQSRTKLSTLKSPKFWKGTFLPNLMYSLCSFGLEVYGDLENIPLYLYTMSILLKDLGISSLK